MDRPSSACGCLCGLPTEPAYRGVSIAKSVRHTEQKHASSLTLTAIPKSGYTCMGDSSKLQTSLERNMEDPDSRAIEVYLI